MFATDDRWKLACYANGSVTFFDLTFFDLQNDPHEQRNLAYHPDALEPLARLDRALQAHLLRSLVAATPEFGRPGWERPYPYRADPWP